MKCIISEGTEIYPATFQKSDDVMGPCSNFFFEKFKIRCLKSLSEMLVSLFQSISLYLKLHLNHITHRI